MKSLSRYCMLLAVALLTLSLEAAAQTPTRPGAIDVEMLVRAERRADALQSQLLDLQQGTWPSLNDETLPDL